MDKVSIIIPIYNVDKYLNQCINSVINQTYKNLEILLIDDGSTDKSGSICDAYAEKDSRIKVFHQVNAGAANAKNKGLDLATGDYIAFIDSDDIAEECWIDTMVTILNNYSADMCECRFDKYYIDRYEKLDENLKDINVFSSEEYLNQYLDDWTCSLFWTKLFKRELTENIRFRKERRCIDDEFYTYKVISNAKKIVKINNILYHYRQRKSSAVQSRKNQLQITKDAIELRIERYNWIKKKYPQIRKKYLDSDMNFLLFFSHNSLFDLESNKIFHNASKFYLKETLKLGVNINLLRISFKLLMCKPIMNNNSKTTTVLETTEDCFE